MPDGKKYDDVDEMSPDANTPPMDLDTFSFFHVGNIDDDSENWLIPFIEQYQSSCQNCTTHVILLGACVEDSGVRQFDDGPITSDGGLAVFIEWMKNESFLELLGAILKQRDNRCLN